MVFGLGSWLEVSGLLMVQGATMLWPVLLSMVHSEERFFFWVQVANLGKSGVSVGYYDTEEAAARAYDRAAIGLLGSDNGSITTNFPLEDYHHDTVSFARW